MLPLQLEVHARDVDVVIAAVGELDISGTDMLADLLRQSVPAACRRIIIDASQLTFLDAAGLRAIRGAPDICGSRVEVCVLDPSIQVQRVLEVASRVGAVHIRCERTARGAHLLTLTAPPAEAAGGN